MSSQTNSRGDSRPRLSGGRSPLPLPPGVSFRARRGICFSWSAALEEVEPSGESHEVGGRARRGPRRADALRKPRIPRLQPDPSQMVLQLSVINLGIVVREGLAQSITDAAAEAAGKYHPPDRLHRERATVAVAIVSDEVIDSRRRWQSLQRSPAQQRNACRLCVAGIQRHEPRAERCRVAFAMARLFPNNSSGRCGSR